MKDRRQTSFLGFEAKPQNGTVNHADTTNTPEDIAPEPLHSPPATGSPTDNLDGRTIWVIDAHSLIHQVFHALPEMTSPKGEPVEAVYGFTRDLIFLLEQKKPDYLFCAFDLPGKTFRHEMYAEYKEQRAETPDNLRPQFSSVRRVVAAMGIPALDCESYEADDVLATVAKETERLGGKCFLVTGDKDSRQLITNLVKVYNIRKNEIYDEEKLLADWGVLPEQVVDFQAMVGDSVDNVPGVPLIGPKFARQVLEKYGTLEAVLDHADEVAGAKRKENLVKYRDQALLSRDLVRLDDNVPVTIDWNAGRTGQIDLDATLALFHEFGFRGIGQKLTALAARGPAASAAGEMSDQLAAKAASPKTHLVDTPEAFASFLEKLRSQKCISIDTETTDIRPRWAKLVGISMSWNDAEAWYLPLRSPEGEAHLDPVETIAALKPILEDPAIGKIGQNIKYDMIVLRSAGIHLAGTVMDTMVASYLLEAGQRNHNIDELARTYLGHETVKITELIGKGKNQKRMDEVPVRQVADYAGEDAWVPLRLRPILAERLKEDELDDLLDSLELPLIDVLAEMEYCGIRVNADRLNELSSRYGRRMEELEQTIHREAGREINIASPKQLQVLLFEELNLPVIKKTAKTGPSTDAEVLEELAPLHPLPAMILQYRQYAKLKGTYVDALPEMIYPETGRVHASFHQAVTATGRLSSSDPNLQNIPVRTEEGREIRSAFVAGEEGWLLLAADYSQIELRVLAHFSGDARLAEAFARDEDIHARVAGSVNNVPLDEVTPEMRRAAKAVNFGVIYGQSPFGLARALGIEQNKAAEFIDNYFEGYPGIEEFLAKVLADCRKNGYVKTILGRRRAISGVREDAGRQRNLAERTAVNTVIQGSAADIIKLAMIAIHRRLKKERLSARMLLQIHDELILEVPADQLDHLAALVREEMNGAWALNVPLKVDMKFGPNWAETEEIGDSEVNKLPEPRSPTCE